MTADQDLAGLPKDVREAWRNIDYATPDVRGTCIAPTAALETIFHDHMRLARENADLRSRCNVFVQSTSRFRGEKERAEAELEALKRRIAKAPVMRIDPVGDGAYWSMADGTSINELNALIGQRVALLMVGGE